MIGDIGGRNELTADEIRALTPAEYRCAVCGKTAILLACEPLPRGWGVRVVVRDGMVMRGGAAYYCEDCNMGRVAERIVSWPIAPYSRRMRSRSAPVGGE